MDKQSGADKAKIPDEYRAYKTKPELALKIIDETLLDGVLFDRIGGDGLYGHNSELTRSLDERGLFYVLDVHKDEHIYLEEPPTLNTSPQNSKRHQNSQGAHRQSVALERGRG